MSSFAEGQVHQLVDALEGSGFTSKDLTRVGQLPQLRADILSVIRGEKVITFPIRTWEEHDGVISFSVTSDGTTGEEWIARLEKKGLRVGDYAKSLLRSKDFVPTKGVTSQIAVLKGELFSDDDRVTKTIRAEGKKRKLSTPNAEIACLIREKFSDKELEAMGLWRIIVMHEPIKDSGGGLSLLGAYRNDDGQWLDTYYDNPDNGWNREGGFAFVSAQVST
jgi:hypothetical protein